MNVSLTPSKVFNKYFGNKLRIGFLTKCFQKANNDNNSNNDDDDNNNNNNNNDNNNMIIIVIVIIIIIKFKRRYV